MDEVSHVLKPDELISDGSDSQELLPLLYDKLRRLAARKLSQERPGQTLDATGLVHEAYLRLVAGRGNAHWDSRGHFFQAAAEAMRRILINRARDKKCLKRGGDLKRVAVENLPAADQACYDDLLALQEALSRLADENQHCADLVTLRYFGGLSLREAAATLDIPLRTANRHWAFARAWLYEALGEPPQAVQTAGSGRAF
ncbi:MAG TPA: ECF-type sigma factor [Pirellulales bacterium]|jgi:RNA polymerase sigma factor (TIGR02999 family)|nr:ECF-type sigma factor [Pirellulales bacterium]